jgi:type I restriction enzyme, S subunit
VNYGDIHSKFRFEVDPDRHALKFVSPDYMKANESSLLKRGDFVFADTSEDIEGSGNFTHLASDIPTFAGYHTLIARPDARAVTRFLAYMLDSRTFRQQVQKAVKGVKVYSISQGLLKDTEVLLPPPREQRAIATYLDGKCAKIDEAVRIKEEQIALLRERRQILIQEAVTRGLNPDAPMKDSGIAWIGQIPAHWYIENPKWLFKQRKQRALKGEPQLAATQKYGVIPQDHFMEREGRRIVQVFLDFDILKHVEAGDFVMSMRSFQGGLEYTEFTGCVSSAYVALEPGPKIYCGFYRHLFKSKRYIEALQSTSNLVRDGQALRFENFSMIPLPVVPIAEQKAIAKYIDEVLIKIEKACEIRGRQISVLKEYKISLINAAVTGRIKVI